MTQLRLLRRFARSSSGVSAAEFSLVLPLFLLTLLGIIDVGLYGWQINQGEKATQMGARMAVVTDPVDSAMASYSFVGKTVAGTTYTQGDIIGTSALGLETCDDTGCTCNSQCPWTPGYNSNAFGRIVTRMQKIDPKIQASNVVIEYRGSGLGYAGDPGGMEIAPLTTVKLKNMSFAPLTLFLFDAAIPLPSFSYSLTMEDGSGSTSN